VLLAAKASLPSCINTPVVAAPPSPIDIPRHYLNGSHGPTNPAEAAATRVYAAFENRITAGMNQYVATGSEAEAKCALDQLDSWAQAKALLNYDPQESSQAWYQVEWTLSSAGITDSVLVTDAKLDRAKQKRVIAWLNLAAHKLIAFEKPTDNPNNHHYWRALAAISVGVVSSDNKLFDFGIKAYKQAIGEIDARGALPREMARHERASHYQTFALQPLIPIAEFATRQHINLYDYAPNGRSIRDAILFFGRAVSDPSLIKPYTSDQQDKNFGSSDFAPYVFYAARFGTIGLPSSITAALQHPLAATRIGGSTTILAATGE
ncbi:MAG: alginate lyase family protein, partial [Edaphobacter sp.]